VTSATNTPVRQLASLADISSRYDALLCDVWGVLHNGERAFVGAANALVRARRQGLTVILITNAPRPAFSVAEQLEQLGIRSSAYDAIATSGDVTRALVTAQVGKPLYHIGPARDASLFDGLKVALSDAAGASAIICTGLFDDLTETPADYEAELTELAKRRLPFICANPDLIVERGHSICYCAGALAALYAEKGGPVLMAGKPHRPIYELAAALVETLRAAPVPKSRILAIGDGLGTDMAGAGQYGIDALFIPSGVSMPHGQTLDVDALFKPLAMRPVAMMPALAWP
jgi:HAD superfamily hydrolase (TIGR01459 family)